MAKTIDDVYDLLGEMASNSYQWPRDRSLPKKARVREINAISALTAQISTLSKQFGTMNVNTV